MASVMAECTRFKGIRFHVKARKARDTRYMKSIASVVKHILTNGMPETAAERAEQDRNDCLAELRATLARAEFDLDNLNNTTVQHLVATYAQDRARASLELHGLYMNTCAATDAVRLARLNLETAEKDTTGTTYTKVMS
jgi:hypothetical protein